MPHLEALRAYSVVAARAPMEALLGGNVIETNVALEEIAADAGLHKVTLWAPTTMYLNKLYRRTGTRARWIRSLSKASLAGHILLNGLAILGG